MDTSISCLNSRNGLKCIGMRCISSTYGCEMVSLPTEVVRYIHDRSVNKETIFLKSEVLQHQKGMIIKIKSKKCAQVKSNVNEGG